MNVRIAGLAIAALGVLGLTGCAARETRWSGDAAKLAVYATQVPLYPGAESDGAMGSDSYGDDPESHSEGMTFWFNVAGSKEEVAAWYDARLPGARKNVEAGLIVYTLSPEGAESGEEMGVIVDEGRIGVFEHTRPGKHKDA